MSGRLKGLWKKMWVVGRGVMTRVPSTRPSYQSSNPKGMGSGSYGSKWILSLILKDPSP